MKNGPETNKQPTQASWENFDDHIKLIGLGGVGITATVIMATLGPQALYLLIGTVALGTFAIYPEIEPERVLWGAAIGALCAGPVGIILGAGVGHYLGKKYDAFMRLANPVIQAASTTFSFASSTTTPLLKGAAQIASTASKIEEVKTGLYSNISKGAGFIQNATKNITNTLTREFITAPSDEAPSVPPTIPVLDVQAEKTAKTPEKPTEVQATKTTPKDIREDILVEQPKVLTFTDNHPSKINTKSNNEIPLPVNTKIQEKPSTTLWGWLFTNTGGTALPENTENQRKPKRREFITIM